jgi:hypothetical protein
MPGSYEAAAGLVTGLVIGATSTYLILKAKASKRVRAAAVEPPPASVAEVKDMETAVVEELATKKPHRLGQAWRRGKSAFTPTNTDPGESGGGGDVRGGGGGGRGGPKRAPSLRILSRRASLMQSSMDVDVDDDDDDDGDGAGGGSRSSQLLDELKELTNDAAGGGITLSKDDLRTLTNKVTMTMNRRRSSVDLQLEAIERREKVARHISNHTSAVPDKFQDAVKGFIMDQYCDDVARTGGSMWSKIRDDLHSKVQMVKLKQVGLHAARSIADVIKIKKKTHACISPYLSRPDEQAVKVIGGIGKWDFDLFAVDEMSGGKALVVVGTVLFNEHDLLSVFKIKPIVLENFLQAVSDAYIADNTYHNALHGADVTQTLHYFVQSGGMSQYMNQEMIFTSIVAALIHDCGHPGVNNSFLVKTSDELAIRYNDQSPLENMHCATAFGLMGSANVNRDVLGNIPKQSRETVREAIISMVLATDNSHHFKHIGELKATLAQGMDPASDKKHLSILLNIALHAADVSNPAKPFETYMRWTNRVLAEVCGTCMYCVSLL